jgi:phosphoglycolate phosphatase
VVTPIGELHRAQQAAPLRGTTSNAPTGRSKQRPYPMNLARPLYYRQICGKIQVESGNVFFSGRMAIRPYAGEMVMDSIKHIIWDWNGTLLDDAWLCVEIMNGMLARRRLPPLTPETYERIFDFPVADYYRKVGFDFSVDPFEKLSDEFMAVYNRRVRDCPLRAGARDILAAGQARGITQSILSAMKQETLVALVDHFDLTSYFTDVTGLADHHAAGKLELAQQWMAAQDLRRKDILFVGDTVHDYEVAQALGVACVQIHSGHHSRARLAACGVPILESLAGLYA